MEFISHIQILFLSENYYLYLVTTEYSGDGFYKPEEIYDHLDPDAVDCGDEDDESSPFDRLSREMAPITGQFHVTKQFSGE